MDSMGRVQIEEMMEYEFKPPEGQDARHYDPISGRFVCNKEHPWDGDMKTAPDGVLHEDVGQEDGFRVCENCGVKW